MFRYILISSLLFALVSSQANLEWTDSTYALYMKSDEYKNNIEKQVPGSSALTYSNGFFIGKLKNKDSGTANGAGTLTITVKKNENEKKSTVVCGIMDLSVANQGICLFCNNGDEYDLIKLTPGSTDTIKIEGIEKITLSDSSSAAGKNKSSFLKVANDIGILFALFLFI